MGRMDVQQPLTSGSHSSYEAVGDGKLDALRSSAVEVGRLESLELHGAVYARPDFLEDDPSASADCHEFDLFAATRGFEPSAGLRRYIEHKDVRAGRVLCPDVSSRQLACLEPGVFLTDHYYEDVALRVLFVLLVPKDSWHSLDHRSKKDKARSSDGLAPWQGEVQLDFMGLVRKESWGSKQSQCKAACSDRYIQCLCLGDR